MGKPFFLHKSFWKMVFKGIDYDTEKDGSNDSGSDYKKLFKGFRRMNRKEWLFFIVLLMPILISFSCSAIFSFLSYKSASLFRTFYSLLTILPILVVAISYTRFLRKNEKRINRIYRRLKRKSKKSKPL
jgi:ABC-type sugar transport system permease subunit